MAMNTDKSWRVNTPTINFERLDDEVVAIHMPTGMYFSLEDAAVEAWAVLEASASFDQIVARLVATHDVTPEQARADLAPFLDRLLQEELIEEHPAGTVSAIEPGKRRAYTGLKVEKFSDLQYLLMIDPVHEVQKEGWPHTKED